MQSTNELGKIVQANILDNKLNLLSQRIQEAENKGAVRHVIAKMPADGSELEINGLKYKVTYVNNKRGDLHLTLIGTESQQGE